MGAFHSWSQKKVLAGDIFPHPYSIPKLKLRFVCDVEQKRSGPHAADEYTLLTWHCCVLLSSFFCQGIGRAI